MFGSADSRRWIGIMLGAACLAACLAAGGARAADVPAVRKDLQVEDLGVLCKRLNQYGGPRVFKDVRTGHLHLWLNYHAGNGLVGDPRAKEMGPDAPMQLVTFDLNTGEGHKATGPACIDARNPFVHSSGTVYGLTSRPLCLFEYDPQTGALKTIGQLVDDYFCGAFNVTEAADGKMYIGTHPGYACVYDPKTGEYKNFGMLTESPCYLQTIAADDKYLYCGPWAYGQGGMIVYELATGKYEHFFRPPPKTETGKGGKAWRGDDGKAYFTNEGKTWGFVDGKPVEVAKPPAGIRTYNSRDFKNVWDIGPAERELGFVVDLGDAEPNNWNGASVTVRYRFKSDAEEAYEKEAVAARKKAEQTGTLSAFNREYADRIAELADWKTASVDGLAIYPNVLRVATPTEDGKVVFMSAYYGPVFTYDPKKKTTQMLGQPHISPYDMEACGNMVYISGYSSVLLALDLKQPWTYSLSDPRWNDRSINPFKMSAAKRATHIAIAGGRVYCTGNNARHSWGANLVVWDPVRGQHESDRNLVKDYSSRDLVASSDGRYVLFATAAGEGTKAALFVFDPLTRELQKRIEMPFEDTNNWGNIFAGPDGTIVGLIMMDKMLPGEAEKEETIQFYAPKYERKFRVYTYDYVHEKVIAQKDYEGYAFRGPTYWGYRSLDRRFCLGPDGCGWLFVDDWLTRVHPDATIEKVMQMEHPGMMFFIGDDMYLYAGGRSCWGDLSNLRRIKEVFQR